MPHRARGTRKTKKTKRGTRRREYMREVIDRITRLGDIDEVDDEGYTPIMIAFLYSNLDLVKQILKRKPDLEIAGPDGTVLEMAEAKLYSQESRMEKDDFIPEVIRLLVNAGVDTTKQDSYGNTILHRVFWKINKYEPTTPRLFEMFTAVAFALLYPGMKLDIKNNRGDSILDLYFSGAYYDIITEMLYYAGASLTDTQFAFAHNTSNTEYIFSQRGGTCGSDAFFTLLILSDATRPYFRAIFKDTRSRYGTVSLAARAEYINNGSIYVKRDTLAEAIESAIDRYYEMMGSQIENVREVMGERRLEDMKAARNRRLGRTIMTAPSINTKPRRPRRASVSDTCLSLSMLGGIVDDPSIKESTGINTEQVIKISDILFKDRKYDLFPEGLLSYFRFSVIDSLLDKLTTMDITKVEATYLGIIPKYTEEEVAHIARLGGHFKSGHAIAIFRYRGQWVLSDNEAGFLHVFKDQTFVSDHLLPALQTDISKIDVALIPIFHSLEAFFKTPTATYPNIPAIEPYIKYQYRLGSGVIYSRP